jgi:hypothetical protein
LNPCSQQKWTWSATAMHTRLPSTVACCEHRHCPGSSCELPKVQLEPTCLSSILPRLKMMQPRASDMGIMNMGKTYSTAILRHATHLQTVRLQPEHTRIWIKTSQVCMCRFRWCLSTCQLDNPYHTRHMCRTLSTCPHLLMSWPLPSVK